MLTGPLYEPKTLSRWWIFWRKRFHNPNQQSCLKQSLSWPTKSPKEPEMTELLFLIFFLKAQVAFTALNHWRETLTVKDSVSSTLPFLRKIVRRGQTSLENLGTTMPDRNVTHSKHDMDGQHKRCKRIEDPFEIQGKRKKKKSPESKHKKRAVSAGDKKSQDLQDLDVAVHG